MENAKQEAKGFCDINDSQYPLVVLFTFYEPTQQTQIDAYFRYFSLLLKRETKRNLRIIFDLRNYTNGTWSQLEQQRDFSAEHKCLYRQRLRCTAIVAESIWTRWAVRTLLAWQGAQMPNRVVSTLDEAIDWMKDRRDKKSMDSM